MQPVLVNLPMTSRVLLPGRRLFHDLVALLSPPTLAMPTVSAGCSGLRLRLRLSRRLPASRACRGQGVRSTLAVPGDGSRASSPSGWRSLSRGRGRMASPPLTVSRRGTAPPPDIAGFASCRAPSPPSGDLKDRIWRVGPTPRQAEGTTWRPLSPRTAGHHPAAFPQASQREVILSTAEAGGLRPGSTKRVC